MAAQQLAAQRMFQSNSERLQLQADALRNRGSLGRNPPEQSKPEFERLRAKDYGGLRQQAAKESVRQIDQAPSDGKLSFLRDRSDKEQKRSVEPQKDGQLSFPNRSPGRGQSHDR